MISVEHIFRLALILVFCFFKSKTLAQDTFIKMMNDTIHSIKYVFEARLDSIQTFVGDETGNMIPAANANWKNGLGYFEDKSGTSLKVYSKVWITVCKSYKGKPPAKMVILLPDEFTSAYAQVTPSGDTVCGFVESYPSHGNYERALLPSKSYPIYRLYWCYDVVKQKRKGEYAFKTFLHMPLRIQAFVPQSDGSGKNEIIYTMISDRIFEKKEEFEYYLQGMDLSK